MKIKTLDILNDIRQTGMAKILPGRPRINVGMGTCGIGNGADKVMEALLDALQRKGVDASVVPVGCFGFCAAEPLVSIHLPNQPLVMYSQVTLDDVDALVDGIGQGKLPQARALFKIEAWDHITGHITYGSSPLDLPHWHEIPFYRGQKKIVLRNAGLINPSDIDEYIAVGGYQALYQALQKPEHTDIIEEVKRAKLRGRGGAGYPAGVKWDLLQKAEADQKFLICNADEGDPGAYMNRNEIESDPHALLEGMLIGAYATGSTDGVVYLRAEYPLAVQRLEKALHDAQAYGLAGEDILGEGFSFDLQLVEGAGAFVCGEETAMIASLEGKSGRPRPRPPYPAQKGLWGKPTNINNVETWFNVPVIVARGGAWFAQTGTANSSGTKVFSLVGKIKNTGLVEMPLGTTLRKIVYGAGEGSPTGRDILAVQAGGPSGGCIPKQYFDTPVDYEALGTLGAIMGSGGMVVMDEDTCMVDVARYFVEFSRSESCGKCVPCRVGLDQALRILNRITNGQADFPDLHELRDLSYMIRETSLCGLGQSAPNPVLTTLRYFYRDYDEHIRVNRCRAGVCEKLFVSPCENTCPLHMRIPVYLQLMKEKRIEDAAELVWMENPLPASTGRLCIATCEDRCRRQTVDEAVNMKEVHRYIADTALGEFGDTLRERLAANRLEASGKRVAVVGSGPAGLTAAFYANLFGHDVTVFEAREEAGGVLRYGVPTFRLPRQVLDREIEMIASLGVTFAFGRELGKDLAIDELETEYDATFVATGAWAQVRAGLPGEDAPGVWHSTDFLEQAARGLLPQPGRHVVVSGEGHEALDCARSARRMGAETTVLFKARREAMAAMADDFEQAEADGVALQFDASVYGLVLDEDGKVSGVSLTGAQGDVGRQLPCDSFIYAGARMSDTDSLQSTLLTINADGTVAADPLTGKTDRPHTYAGGALTSKSDNMAEAMASGKAAAKAIDRLLTREDRGGRVFKALDYKRKPVLRALGGERNESAVRDVNVEQDPNEEVLMGLSPEQAAVESKRCLRCDVKAECVHPR